MQMVGHCDRYRLDVTRRHRIQTGRPGAAVFFCQCPSGAFIAIADDGQVAARMGRERERVIGPQMPAPTIPSSTFLSVIFEAST
jgi:hypothetical protein